MRLRALWALAAAGLAGGCHLISGLSGIEANPLGSDASGGGPASSSAATGGDGGMAVSSASTGGGGQGGAGGCDAPRDCPAPSDECQIASCDAGECGSAPAPSGTSCEGDKLCDGNGNCLDAGCLDATKNGTETDVDCGGDDCPACAENACCAQAEDCLSLFCDTASACAGSGGGGGGEPGSCEKCTTSADCAGLGEFFCNLFGACEAKKALGQSCFGASGDESCLSAICSDDVCCESECSGGCESCSMPTAGQCTSYAEGDPGDAECGAYLCDGSSDCPTSCDMDSDCVAGGFCDQGVTSLTYQQCFAAKEGLGEMCAMPNECATGYCVDLTCCATQSCPGGQTCITGTCM